MVSLPVCALEMETTQEITNLQEEEAPMDRAAEMMPVFEVEPVTREDFIQIAGEESLALESELDEWEETKEAEVISADEPAERLAAVGGLDLEPDETLAEIPDSMSKDASMPTRGVQSGSDLVEISGNNYAVLTPEGIGIAYTAGEDVVVFTQDYLQQSELFQKYYKNPIGAVSAMIDERKHLNVYDPQTEVDLFVCVFEGEWEQLYPDSNNLTDAEVRGIMMYLESCGFDEAANKTFGMAGGNQYFLFDLSQTEGYVVMFASVNGYRVRVHYFAKTQDQVLRGLEMMEGLVIRAI